MSPLGTGARLAIGGAMLAGLVLQIASSSAQTPTGAETRAGAQTPTGEQQLLDRIRRIQGGLGPGGAAARPAAASEQELIERVQALEREARAESAAGAQPELGEDEIAALLRAGFGVEILKIEPIEAEGRPAYVVTVMNPPGNDNSAFAVETLVVDGATGALLGRVPQVPRTATPGAAASLADGAGDGGGLEIRRRTYR